MPTRWSRKGPALTYPRYPQGRLFVFLIIIGLTGYELFEHFSPRSQLDWRDKVATLIAGTVSPTVYERVCRRETSRERVAGVAEPGRPESLYG